MAARGGISQESTTPKSYQTRPISEKSVKRPCTFNFEEAFINCLENSQPRSATKLQVFTRLSAKMSDPRGEPDPYRSAYGRDERDPYAGVPTARQPYDPYERRERYDYRDPYGSRPPYDPYDPYARHYPPPPGAGAYGGGYYPPPPGYGYGHPPPHYPPPDYPHPG